MGAWRWVEDKKDFARYPLLVVFNSLHLSRCSNSWVSSSQSQADRGQAPYWGISHPGSMPTAWVVQVVWLLAKPQLFSRAPMLPSALKVWVLLVQCNCSHHLRMSLGSETLPDSKKKKKKAIAWFFELLFPLQGNRQSRLYQQDNISGKSFNFAGEEM